jgi:OmpA family
LLSDELTLTQIDESHWTAGSAIQGASAVGTAVLVAFLVWGPHRFSQSSERVTENKTPSAINALDSYVQFLQTLIPFLIVAAVVGAILMATSKRFLGKIAGSFLLLGTAMAAGKITFDLRDMTLVKVGDIAVKIDKKGDSNLPPNPFKPEKSFHAVSYVLPPFADATHSISEEMRCVLDRLAPFVVSNLDSVQQINIITSADRRELLPEPRKKYSTNWGLARRRADSIQSWLLDAGIQKDKLISHSIGPKVTELAANNKNLSVDRQTTIYITTTNRESRILLEESRYKANNECLKFG